MRVHASECFARLSPGSATQMCPPSFPTLILAAAGGVQPCSYTAMPHACPWHIDQSASTICRILLHSNCNRAVKAEARCPTCAMCVSSLHLQALPMICLAWVHVRMYMCNLHKCMCTYSLAPLRAPGKCMCECMQCTSKA